ncbi:hypothetical protein MKX01_013911, partial [Papaver californicum]
MLRSPASCSVPPVSCPSNPRNVVPHHFKPIVVDRRQILISLTTISVTPLLESTNILSTWNANASLFQMPPYRLNNRESEYESLGQINTNPVAKTSTDSGLSIKGKKKMVRAALKLKAMGACDQSCWLWPSITQRAYQDAENIASANEINSPRSLTIPLYRVPYLYNLKN